MTDQEREEFEDLELAADDAEDVKGGAGIAGVAAGNMQQAMAAQLAGMNPASKLSAQGGKAAPAPQQPSGPISKLPGGMPPRPGGPGKGFAP